MMGEKDGGMMEFWLYREVVGGKNMQKGHWSGPHAVLCERIYTLHLELVPTQIFSLGFEFLKAKTT